MPMTAIPELRCDMACSLSSVPQASFLRRRGWNTAGPSPVKHTAHGFPSPRGLIVKFLRRWIAEEKAGPKDVGEQALMRGLDTAFPFFRPGLSWSSVGR
jgi:hypothetical protein